ncbi:MAG: chorismate synthase [Candidatus Pacebacteria bacterium]|nr:chorismate synthase [Candidatus Paceibacterota bacterium]
MSGNTFGQLFKITTFGESHGEGVGCVIDGCPAGLELSSNDIQKELDKRKPGQSKITTTRQESDTAEILSGVFEGRTIGTPIMIFVRNKNQRPEDYAVLKDLYRPSHADYVYEAKYGFRDWRGGGRASARETIGRVAGGAVAIKFLKDKAGLEFVSYVEQIGDIKADVDYREVMIENVEANIVRCPDQASAQKMTELIEKTREQGDSLGGVIVGVVRNAPVGLGEPVFDKLSADLAKAMLSIPAVKGFEYGSGFASVTKRGSEHNDEFYAENGKIMTRTNNSGGIQGGISNGQDIYFRVAFKAPATIGKEQRTIDKKGKEAVLAPGGRHDPCVLPRAVPIVSSMAALVVMDHYLRQKVSKS